MNYQDNNFTASLQYGKVSAIDATTHSVKVDLPALESMTTHWLPVITLGAYANQFYALPDIGTLVVCLMNATGDGGVVLGGIYNDIDTPPASSENIWMKKFKNGTIISHDRSSGAVVVQTSGAVTVTASSVTVNAPTITLNGNVKITGAVSVAQTVNATGGVTGAGVSLSTHTHGGVESGNKRTSGPA